MSNNFIPFSQNLKNHKQEWEELASLDPYWAILSESHRKFGKWDQNEFFLPGDRGITNVIEIANQLDHPSEWRLALDFGCGVGRLTRALAKYFEQCVGIDISETMIAHAHEINNSFLNCTFMVNTEDNLKVFPDGYFDLLIPE